MGELVGPKHLKESFQYAKGNQVNIPELLGTKDLGRKAYLAVEYVFVKFLEKLSSFFNNFTVIAQASSRLPLEIVSVHEGGGLKLKDLRRSRCKKKPDQAIETSTELHILCMVQLYLPTVP